MLGSPQLLENEEYPRGADSAFSEHKGLEELLGPAPNLYQVFPTVL